MIALSVVNIWVFKKQHESIEQQEVVLQTYRQPYPAGLVDRNRAAIANTLELAGTWALERRVGPIIARFHHEVDGKASIRFNAMLVHGRA